jgi:hypothetical protein
MSSTDLSRDLIVWTLAKTPEGRSKLIASAVNPMSMSLNFRSLTGQLLAEGIGVEDPQLFEAEVHVPWEEFKVRRFHTLDKIQTKLVDEFKAVVDRRLLALVHEVGPPITEEFPEDRWDKVLVNVRTLVEMRKQELLDPPSPADPVAQYYRKARVVCSRAVEPGLLYAFGIPANVGFCQYGIEITDASEPHFDGAAFLKNIGFKGTLTHRMQLVEDPQVGVYLLG